MISLNVQNSHAIIGLPPSITAQPQSRIVVAGDTVTFSVNASSSTPLSYQWQRGFSQVTGATNATLVLTNVQVGVAGPYSVVVANAAGSVTSAEASLSVAQVLDQSVSLAVDALFALQRPSQFKAFQWRFNGVDLPGATNSLLVITNVQLIHDGIYSVFVTNAAGAVTTSARLLIDPTFTKITQGHPVTTPGFSGGAAWMDYDLDGRLDLVVANGLNGDVVLYRNDGPGGFTPSVLPLRGEFYGAAWGDYDNDGLPDLFQANWHSAPNTLYRNLGQGVFSRTNFAAFGLPTDGVWADYDGDGFLDLFVSGVNGGNLLYHNDGNGNFTRVIGSAISAAAPSDKTAWADFDNDGFPDLFVFNARNPLGTTDTFKVPHFLFRNNADGTFTRMTNSVLPAEVGIATGGIAWGDYDNDGFLDLFLANGNYGSGRFKNSLYHNNGDGTFTPVTSGDIVNDLGSCTTASWEDYDNDGWLDLFVSHHNGVSPGENNALYHNNGDGTFTKITTGSLVNDLGSSNGAAWGDYNEDGFPDLYVANYNNEKNFFYLNNGNANNWIKLHLVGKISNRSAIGAKVRVKTVLNRSQNPEPTWQLREVSNGDGISGNSLDPHFGLGQATNVDTVRIEWPSGIVQELRNVAPKQFLTVTEDGVAIAPRVQDWVVGSNHVFTAKATFGGELKYQWRFNGADLPGQTNQVLTVAAVGVSSVGEYSVAVTSANGSTVLSSAALLRMPGPPVITVQPQSQFVVAGGTVTLGAGTLPSSRALSFQWTLNGAAVPGATFSTLVLTNAQFVNGGSYALIATNEFGSTASAAADLVVVRDESTSASLGGTAMLRIIVGDTRPFFYQWRFNGADILGATAPVYGITNARPSDVGQYSVVLTSSFGGFTNVAPALIVDPSFAKITASPVVSESLFSNGVVWADFDNDGWLDLFVAHGRDANNSLFRNRGDGSFEQVVAGPLVNDRERSVPPDDIRRIPGSVGAAAADFDNDGFLDLMVANADRQKTALNWLYRGQPGGAFTRVATGSLVTTAGNWIAPAWGDFDNDGQLDLFVAKAGGTALFRNQTGVFTRSGSEAIESEPRDFLAASWGDYDNDGYLDLFLTGSGTSVLYHNQAGALIKTASTLGGIPTTGFSCAWGDYDNDGFLDLFMTRATGKNILYHNQGDGTFQRITSGEIVNDPASSWGCAWGDFDNDGWLDLFVTNGTADDNQKNYLYHNNGDGTFAKIATGSLANDLLQSAGCAWGDYDNDGFLDLYVSNGGFRGAQVNALYHNSGNSNAWINFRLIGQLSNRSAIGAKVRVKAFGLRQSATAFASNNPTIQQSNDPSRAVWQLREISGGTGNGSLNDLRANFGLGQATNVDTVRIEWPSGIVQELRNVAPKQFLTVTEPVLMVDPKAVEFAGGTEVTFSVLTNLTGSTRFQWRLNGADLAGETNPTLRVRSVAASSAGKYAVVVTLANGDTVQSTAGVIKPPVPPTITQEPASVSVDPGAEATFSVVAAGSAPLSYQWLLEGVALAGATNATLIVTNAQPENAGAYSVVVTNPGGSITSTNAVLTLIGAPVSGSGYPADLSVSLGANASFVARVVVGTTPLIYQWRLNGLDIPGATNRTFSITNVTLQDSGKRFTVLVKNALGSTTSREASLTVDPTFTKITTGPIVTELNWWGAGATWGDYNNDGFIDLFVGQSDYLGNRLYRNNGDGTFASVLAADAGAILSVFGDTVGTVWGDYDNDGFLDLFVTNASDKNYLFRNLGNGSFERILTGPVANDRGDSRGAVWGDFDNDGFLDLYVPHARDGIKVLYHNNGDGTFSRFSAGAVTNDRGYSLGASWGDFNNDGLLDLFVNNSAAPDLGGPNLLYQNNGQGSFTKISKGNIVTDIGGSGGCAWADYDNDGFLDLFVANVGTAGEKVNFLYHNNGDGTFTRVTNAGPIVTDPASAWDCAWADYDNDGYLDLFVANPAGPKNYLYHNKCDGTFEKITTGSLANDQYGQSNASASCSWGDYDNDGFLDLFAGNWHAEGIQFNYLYRNNGNNNGWLKLKLIGTASNRSAIGAKVRVKATLGGKTFWQLREISGGGGYRSQNGLLPHFGLGDAKFIDTVRIEWPSGAVQEIHNVAVKQFLTVVEPPRLGSPARQADGSVQFNLIGAAGLPSRVETSTNLADWTPLVTVTNRTRIEPIVDSGSKDSRQRFYRAAGQ